MIQTKADYIHARIAEGEHQQQDFKFEISDARKIAKSLSAFSNTDGGRLLVGVKDNGKIAGVRSEEEIYMIEAAAKLYCKPQIDCEMHVHTVEGRTVLEVIVPPGEQKPYCAKDHDNRWWAYIRVILWTTTMWNGSIQNCRIRHNSSRYMCCCIPCRGSLLFIMDRNLA